MPAPTAVLFIWVGAGNILALKSGGDLVALARLLETAPSGHTSAVNRELLERIGLAPQFDDLNHSCIDEISRSAVTVRLALLETGRGTDSAAQLSERGKMATRAVDQRLACVPVDGNAWYYRARLLDEFGDDPKNVATALQTSYRFAPSERWIMVPRFAFVAPKIEDGDATVLFEFTNDLKRLANALSASELADLYVGVGPRVRGMIAAEIRRQPTVRRASIVTSIDRLGVTLR